MTYQLLKGQNFSFLVFSKFVKKKWSPYIVYKKIKNKKVGGNDLPTFGRSKFQFSSVFKICFDFGL